jgi:hypothetical protein
VYDTSPGEASKLKGYGMLSSSQALHSKKRAGLTLRLPLECSKSAWLYEEDRRVAVPTFGMWTLLVVSERPHKSCLLLSFDRVRCCFVFD